MSFDNIESEAEIVWSKAEVAALKYKFYCLIAAGFIFGAIVGHFLPRYL